MKKVFIFLFCLSVYIVNIYAQDENDASILIQVDGDLPLNEKLKEKICENATILLQTLNNLVYSESNSTPTISSKIISDEGLQELRALWNNKQFCCRSYHVHARLVQYSINAVKDKKECAYELTDIPVMLQEDDGVPQCLNLLFNGQGKICGLTFGIDTNIVRNITDKEGNKLDLARQDIILRFLEEFRTAYNRKDIAFLEKVYSDDALIIVGRTIQKKDNNKVALTNSDLKGLPSKTVEYVKTSKKDYLSRLRGVFNSNEYINVDFENIEIQKHPQSFSNKLFKNHYCVNLDQSWTSHKKNGTGYHDDGYLFLVVNFDDQARPVIQVRTWQNMNETNKKDRITIQNLNVKF